jgi:predicted TPR repeat methyltransferase
MPIGCFSVLPLIVHRLQRQRPRTVLDLGAGMGLWGAAVRQWLDDGWQPRKVRLVGVEGFSGYRNPCWDLYDEMHVGQIDDFLRENVGPWDAVLLLDTLEHFTREAGESVLRNIRERLTASGLLYVATPACQCRQGAVHGNELERHQSEWVAADLERLGFTVLQPGDTANEYGHRMLVATSGKT